MSNKSRKIKIAIFISGTGSNMLAIAKAIDAGTLNAEIKTVLSSNLHAKGIEKARKLGLPVYVCESKDYAELEKLEQRIAQHLHSLDVEYIVMAGYMRKITPVLLQEFPNAVINLHPALLPKYPGAHGIQDAYNAGITIHLANEEYDEGPILFQKCVPIIKGEPIENLEARIHKAEHEAYPYVLQQIAEGKIKI